MHTAIVLFFLLVMTVSGYMVEVTGPEVHSEQLLVVDTAGGGDYSTIQEAIDSSENGTTIRIKPGSYKEHLVIWNKTIDLVGEGDDVIIHGSGTGSVIEIFCDNVTLSGLTIRNEGEVVNGNGAVIKGCSNITIVNCIFEQTYIGVSLLSHDGNLTDNCEIANNICRDNDGDGIYLEAGEGNLIESNTCSENKKIGIRLIGGKGNVIRSNTLNSNDGGILLVGSNDTLVSGNEIRDTNEAVYLEDSSGNTITGNKCRDNWAGLYLVSSHNNSMVGNVCSRGGYNGIYLHRSNDNGILNNTCSRNDLGGIYLSGSRNNIIGSNTCSYNRYHGIFQDDASTGNTVMDNSIRTKGKDGADISFIYDMIVPAILVILIVSAVIVRLRARKTEKEKRF